MSFSVSGVSFLMLSVMGILAIGYMLGRITIKGVNLGDAGVFIVALLYGGLFGDKLSATLMMGDASYATNALKIVENLGLVFFVTAVGFIAGPNFFKNMKKNFFSYCTMGIVIILVGALCTVGCILIDRAISGGGQDANEITAIITGIMSGSLTSTPAFSAAKETAANYQEAVSVGYGIAYLYGVIGVVLFVQIMPKIRHANMAEEIAKIQIVDTGAKKKEASKLFNMDGIGLMPFALAAGVGVIVGSVKFFGLFSLTTTGGCLLTALVFGHFGHFGKMNIMPEKKTLEIFRELGLVLFLIGAGVAGGSNFVKYFKPIYFLYGIIITTIPMIVGFIMAHFVMKMPLLNILGSITGGMTSTPALGTLINTAGTDDVASAYAATYPFALICVVLAAEFIIILL